ncbi:MAG: GNAT family N-acetyltransferase [Candidatus Promineifilaceae bacterium]|nr:GNAT family N-acetyltransferase [Candidatus Promineifilaceae bacterium]
MVSRDVELSDGVVILRPPGPDDVKGLFAAVHESRDALRPWMGWVSDDYTIADTRTWIESQPSNWEEGAHYGFLITDDEGTVLGTCGLGHPNNVHRFANLGYWVRSGRRGEGIAGRATRLLAAFGFRELDLVRVEIVVSVGNAASLRVAEKVGARREGVLRNRILVRDAVHDAVMHSLVPADLGLEPRMEEGGNG